jgi:D-inositol-3-phosphate glycosyltransferase
MARDSHHPRTVRVALIDASGRGGLLRYALSLAGALRAEGVDTTLITSRNASELPPAPAFPIVPMLGGMERRLPRILRALSYGFSLLGLVWFLARRRFDVVHLQESLVPPLDALLVWALRLLGLRVVYVSHDPDQDVVARLAHTRRSVRRWGLAFLFRGAHAVVVLSSVAGEHLAARYGLAPDKMTLVPHANYLDCVADGLPGREEARRRLDLPPGVPVALFFGTIRQTKGLDVLLRAFALVRRDLPEAQLMVAGEPRREVDAADYVGLVRCLGLEDAVRLRFDYVPPDEMPLYFVAADAVVLPYRRVYQSGVFHLAQAFARPVVASTVGSLRDDVRPGRDGLLVPPGDEEALARGIVKLLSDRGRAERMGALGRRRAERVRSWEACARATVEVYGRVLSHRREQARRVLGMGKPTDRILRQRWAAGSDGSGLDPAALLPERQSLGGSSRSPGGGGTERKAIRFRTNTITAKEPDSG